MSKTVDGALYVQGVILRLLAERGPLRRSVLEKEAVKASPSVPRFQLGLNWLLGKGLVAKTGAGWHDPYVIMDKGRAWLKALTALQE